MRTPDSSTDIDFDAVIALPFGPFGIRAADGAVGELVFLPPDTPLRAPTNDTARIAAEALHDWIEHPEQPFPLSLRECGTPFQRRVWAEISAIPAGRTRTYGELSARLGSAARAVGQACGANPIRSSYPAIASPRPAASAASPMPPAAGCSTSSAGC